MQKISKINKLAYQKYRWFFTSSSKLVVGGKNAEQNEQIIKNFVKPTSIVMHTKEPGSSFVVLQSNASAKDLEEASIFCACFSQQWKKVRRSKMKKRKGKKTKKVEVHVFKGSQTYKDKKMKKGTFGVLGKVGKREVPLSLFLTKQKRKLRAVPFSAVFSKRKTGKIIEIFPGNISKEKTADKIFEILKNRKIKTTKQEIMQALPAGGFSIIMK